MTGGGIAGHRGYAGRPADFAVVASRFFKAD
jgi:hypothetical protein